MRVLRLVAVYRVTVQKKKKNTDTSTVAKTLLREYPILKFTFPALVKL